MAKKKEVFLAKSDTLVASLKRHVSFDGIYRDPKGPVARYVIPAGKPIPNHVIVIKEEIEVKPESDSAPAEQDFKKMKDAEKLKAIEVSEDAEQLTGWAVDLKKDSKAYKAIEERLSELEFKLNGGNNG